MTIPTFSHTDMALLDRSRIVAALKLVLPLTALGLLSMVFLLASPVDPTRAIDQAEIDVTDRARDPRLSAARFAGVTDEGAAIRIEADEARSDPGAALRFQVAGFALALDGADGRRIDARSDTGAIDRAAGSFAMEGDIRIGADDGTTLTAARIEGLLDRTRIDAAGPIAGRMGGNDLTAGHLTVTADPDRPGSFRLVFRQGVSVADP